MPYGQPAQLANLTPWQSGNKASRRSKDVERALKLARKATSEAVLYAEKVLRDNNEDTRLRLKAAEILLLHGMPKGDTSKYFGDETVTAITVHIERHERPAEPAIDGVPVMPAITISTVPVGQR